jgi:polyisoprenoid-binding protein YceI
MRTHRLRRAWVVPCAIVFWAALAAAGQNETETVFQLDPAQSVVEFTVGATLHAVHGKFQFRRGLIRFSPATGAASGEFAVDATSAQTGNPGRDRKMHREVLESQTYPEIIFVPQHLSGTLAPTGSSQLRLQGWMRIRGRDHPISLDVPVKVDHGIATADLEFKVPYVQWGLKNPSVLLLRVSNTVEIRVQAAGRLSTSSTPTEPR